jgi:eukaryotic-like serine/threonine-protein kinase
VPVSVTEPVDPVLIRARARVGRVLRGKWHLDVLLGVGGMAAVYAATHRNRTRAAIKMLHSELSVHHEIRARFQREGRAANSIDHPGVVRVLDDDEAEDGSVFLVMELLDGESLEGRAKRLGGKLPIDEVIAAGNQLLDVLAVAHESGIIHRDLKPENIFLTREGQIRVLDFGIARIRELSGAAGHATRAGMAMGTPAYMAPEQARGLWDHVDATSDLWATGATAFALLTGRAVHEGRTTNEILVAAATNRAPGLRSIDPAIPEPVAEVVDKALAFEQEQRWPDARAMQDALRRAYEKIHDSPISSAPKPTVPPSVPDRTLPGSDGIDLPLSIEGAADTTTQAVSTPKARISAVQTAMRRPVALAAAALAIVALAMVIGLVTRNGNSPTAPDGSSPAMLAPAGVPDSRASVKARPAVDDAGAVEGGTAVPIVEKPRPTATTKLKPSSRAPVAPSALPTASAIPENEWKERRR